MQIIENSKIKEKLYIEKLNNALTIVVVPKKVRKKYIVWGTKFGSIDNICDISRYITEDFSYIENQCATNMFLV